MRKIPIVGFVLLAAVMVFVPARSSAQISVGIAVHIGPPALPVYEQPICPAAGYLWTPGYWGYGSVRRRVMDARILGLGRRRLLLSRRILGTAHRILRRH